MEMLAAGYCRVSSDEQRKNQTIENQVNEINSWLEKNKNIKIYDFYHDNGVSGKIPFNERPAGKRLLLAAEEKKFDVVIVTKNDRLARKALVALVAMERLDNLGIQFLSINEPYDLKKPFEKFMLTISAGNSELDLDTIIDRFNNGKMTSIKRGKWLGGLPPYAFVITKNKKLKIFDKKKLLGKFSEADVIRKIFDLCTYNKLSGEKISIILNNESIPPFTPGKNKISHSRVKALLWTGARVRNLLKEEIYKGTYTLGKRSKNKDLARTIKVPAIVTEEQWDMAQEVLKQNLIKSTRNAKRTYLLSSKIVCGKCGRRYSGFLSHSTYYYGCNAHRFITNGNPTQCKNKHLNAKVIENEIWADAKSFIMQPELIKKFLEEKRRELGPTDYKHKLSEVELKLSNLEEKKKRYARYLGIQDNPIMKNIIDELEKIKNEEKVLLDEKKEYELILGQENYEKNKINKVVSLLNKMIYKIEKPTLEEQKEIIGILVDKIIVYPTDLQTNERKVEISYSFSKGVVTVSTWTGLYWER